MTISSLIPDPDDLLALAPEELAGVVLKFLSNGPISNLNRYNFGLHHTYADYAKAKHEPVGRALMEAWVWLEREGLLAPKPGEKGDWVFITRRGWDLVNSTDQQSFFRVLLLPKGQLHPIIAQKVWALFLRGDYDTAIFQAFKEVEVAVRSAGDFPPEEIGTALMRKAFDARNGVLTDSNLPRAERESMAHFFAGAIGLYKNPHSHRHVEMDAEETVELLFLASHLLSIVESRTED